MVSVAGRSWIIIGVGLLAFVAGFLGVAVFRPGPSKTQEKDNHTGQEEQEVGQHKTAFLDSADASPKGLDLQAVSIPDAQAVRRVQDHLGRRGEIAKEMATVGGAYMSNPRRECIADTAAQTTAEVVEDLNDTTVGWHYIRGIQNYVFATDNLTVFALALPRNVKVIRLIEEGRRQPDKVGGLVNAKLHRLSGGYRRLCTQAQRPNSYDQIEAEYAAFACLYVLVNIPYDRGAENVAEFLLSDGVSMLRAKGGRTFVCDALLRTHAEKNPNDSTLVAALVRHMELVGSFKLDRGTRFVSCWNAPWDVHDFLLKMTGRAAEVSQHVDTISVRAIPADIAKTITTEIETAVVRNFVGYCKELRKRAQ